MKSPITTLFLDIGGVLLTNGWDRSLRKRAIQKFELEEAEIEERHPLFFFGLEEDKISMDEYLDGVIFFKKRPFSKEEFVQWITSQSTELPNMIDFLKTIKKRHHLKVISLNNESRVLHEYRAKKFKLDELFDCFLSSYILGMRKPEKEMYRLALDVAHITPHQALYIDDSLILTKVASKMGIHAICHRDFETTKREVVSLFQNPSLSGVI